MYTIITTVYKHFYLIPIFNKDTTFIKLRSGNVERELSAVVKLSYYTIR